MIVKNEELTLARCLNSVKDFVDEIIIVDTGSTDETKNIAKQFTDKIYDFKWCDDFGKARNFSFSKARGKYLMWLDADDVIDKKDLKKLIKLKPLLSGEVDFYMFKYNIAFDECDKPTFTYYRERIIKNNINAKWKGFIHEAIAPFGEIKYLDISVQHKKIVMGGNVLTRVKDSFRRNKEIFEKSSNYFFFVNPMHDKSLLMRNVFYLKYKNGV